MTQKRVSIVILNWNGQALLAQFLPHLIKYTNHEWAEIIVADNDSTDDSVIYIEKNFPSIKILKLDQNYGFAEGYNIALRNIESEYFVLLNSDVEVSPNWLKPLISALDTDRNIAAVQPKIRSQKDKSYFEYAGASGGFIDYLGYPFCRGRIFDTLEKDNQQYNNPSAIFWASGACMAIRSKLYFEVGGLDKSFFAHMEEIDLCWRLNARGYRLQCIPQATVYHVGGATLAENSPRKVFLNFRNNLLMLYKNLPDTYFKRIYTTRLLLDYLAALQMLVSGNKANSKAVHQAHVEFRKIKSKYNQSRDLNLSLATNAKINTIYNRSILWQYYVKRRNFFGLIKWNDK